MAEAGLQIIVATRGDFGRQPSHDRKGVVLRYDEYTPFTMPLDDQSFKTRADEAINDLYQRLVRAAESHDLEVDFNSGALALEFPDPPAKFVVSPNSPVKQIWVSAHSKSFKLDWDESRQTFVLPATSQSLAEMMSAAVTQQLGTPVTL